METITAKLYAHDNYKKDEQANLFFELTNHSEDTVHILKWNTPLEGLKSDCLLVKKNNKKIPYDGRLVKRGGPREQDYVILAPGASVSAKVDISQAYDLSGPGRIKVDFKKEGLVYFRQPATGTLLRGASFTASKQVSLPVGTKPSSFLVSGRSAGRLTEGERVRQAEATAEPLVANNILRAAMPSTPGLLPCTIHGGTAAQQQIAQLAHSNGYSLAVKTLAGMKNNKHYKTWFGVFKQAHFNRVKIHYGKIIHDFTSKHFIYDLFEHGCDDTDYAYTYKGARTVFICKAFWDAPDTGIASRAGTLVHERSHASALTADDAYGEEDCKMLAQKSPGRAIRNADSHEFFAEF